MSFDTSCILTVIVLDNIITCDVGYVICVPAQRERKLTRHRDAVHNSNSEQRKRTKYVKFGTIFRIIWLIPSALKSFTK